jgi:hypothetical protein
MVTVVRDKDVAKAATVISGKFKVVRIELPATKKSLRNIICGRLEDFMAEEGLPFTFPADDQVDSNKDDLSRMMSILCSKPNFPLTGAGLKGSFRQWCGSPCLQFGYVHGASSGSMNMRRTVFLRRRTIRSTIFGGKMISLNAVSG